jgi:UDP-glucose 4-epimerase
VHILVTGAAGFLGSNLCHRLVEAGHSVVGVDDLSNGRLDNLEGLDAKGEFSFANSDVQRGLTEYASRPLGTVVHLAAAKIPRYGNALRTLQVNYHATLAALELARMAGCRCVVASTSDVYGLNPDLPFSEETSRCVIGSSKSPRWAYAVSKLFDEHMALGYQEQHGTPVVILRFFGSYGPRQPLNWLGGPPPVFIEKILRGEPVPLHGDGLQTRSFTYVDDAVDGMMAAIFSDRAIGEIFNIGNDREITVKGLAELIHSLAGVSSPLALEYVPYKSFTGKQYEDVRRRIPDLTHARTLLGFVPKVALEEGLLKTIAWQRSKMGL